MEAKLYRIIFPVNDINKAEKFYSEILKQKGTRVSPGRHYFNLGGTILACYDPTADGDEKGNWEFHKNQYIYISVPDLENIKAEMENLDYKSIGVIKKMPWGERLLYVNDPFSEIQYALLMKKLFLWEIKPISAVNTK